MRLPPLHKIAEKFITDNANGILTGVGVAGVVGTAVLTARATFKASDVFHERQMDPWVRAVDDEDAPNGVRTVEEEWDDISLQTKIGMVWKFYIPPVFIGAATITAIVGANRMSAQRAAALAAAYSLSETRLSEYKDKVLETVGPNKATKIRDEIAQDRVSKDNNSEVIVLTEGDVLCYDMLTGRYFRSSVEKIRKAENKINQELIHHDSASLTMFYDDIGLEATTYTDTVGWNQATDGVVEVQFSTTTSPDDRPCIAIDFNVAPHPSYYHQY